MKKISKNIVLVCGKCSIELKDHEVIEPQKYKTKKDKIGTDTKEYELKDGKRITIPRVITADKHCPKCFSQSNFKFIPKELVKLFEKRSPKLK